MARNKKRKESKGPSPEKHPLEKPPVAEEKLVTPEDLDQIPDEEGEEEIAPDYEAPPPGEGP
jgi:hypothetical protein